MITNTPLVVISCIDRVWGLVLHRCTHSLGGAGCLVPIPTFIEVAVSGRPTILRPESMVSAAHGLFVLLW
jgi:hypothetical protein